MIVVKVPGEPKAREMSVDEAAAYVHRSFGPGHALLLTYQAGGPPIGVVVKYRPPDVA